MNRKGRVVDEGGRQAGEGWWVVGKTIMSRDLDERVDKRRRLICGGWWERTTVAACTPDRRGSAIRRINRPEPSREEKRDF